MTAIQPMHPARPTRRHFLRTLSALALACADTPIPAFAAQTQPARRLGAPQAFSWDALIARAEAMAAEPYRPRPAAPRSLTEAIDYDAHGQIRFDPARALFRDRTASAAEGAPFPLTFFFVGRYFPAPVRMHLLSPGPYAQAREIRFDPADFSMPPDHPARQLGAFAGYAGFRFQEAPGNAAGLDWRSNDWVAFLGASYFRAIGDAFQYGISARGIAIDTAVAGRDEEFPAFTDFYFSPDNDGRHAVVYALLDGPSVTGAYRFVLTRGQEVITEVDAALSLRRDVARLGIAPASSMYWFSETDRPAGADWRPEVHDSDGLAIWAGNGERTWRPLINPPRTTVSAFAVRSPRGFGLMQRDRVFDHYLDGVRYDRRPGLWVEPLSDWGDGTVQLVEIPTRSEFDDNIVAMWVPARPARAGDRYRLRYRLHWRADEPVAEGPGGPLARCVATRTGAADARLPDTPRRFVVEFLGGRLRALPNGVKPIPRIEVTRGTVGAIRVEAVPDDVPGHWRVQFDLQAEATGPAVELRLVLEVAGRPASEVWLFQHMPAPDRA